MLYAKPIQLLPDMIYGGVTLTTLDKDHPMRGKSVDIANVPLAT
jgi:hypothetical protein